MNQRSVFAVALLAASPAFAAEPSRQSSPEFQAFPLSERNLTRVFKRATGISIHEYREQLRLERARDLMRNPLMTLDAVAAASGFADGRQLRRVWSARFGEPPSAARPRAHA